MICLSLENRYMNGENRVNWGRLCYAALNEQIQIHTVCGLSRWEFLVIVDVSKISFLLSLNRENLIASNAIVTYVETNETSESFIELVETRTDTGSLPTLLQQCSGQSSGQVCKSANLQKKDLENAVLFRHSIWSWWSIALASQLNLSYFIG